MCRTLIATAFCCLVSSPAIAADSNDAGAPVDVPPPAEESAGVATPEAAPRKEEVPEVRVVGDKADTLPKVPGSGSVVTEKELKRAQPVETSEMLRRIPGIQA